MNIHILNRTDSVSWVLFPSFQARVKNFCDRYDSDADKDLLARNLELDFVADVPRCLLVAAVDNGEVVGHLFASIDDWMGVRYLTIIQYELDVKLPLELHDKAFESIRQWGAENGATKFQILARNEGLARYFVKRYSFKPERVLMRRNI